MVQKLLHMSEIASSLKLADSKNLASCVRCHVYTFHTEESSCSLKIFVDGLSGATPSRIQTMLKNEIPTSYFDKLLAKLLTESDPSHLSCLHLSDAESLLEYI